ncbi:insulinase family protein [bacterium]|nr:insulinase family protein [bacterium]
MKRLPLVILLSALSLFGSCAPRKTGMATPEENVRQSLNLDAALLIDPGVAKGKLDNGLTWYVRENGKPEKRMELRLVVKAGSVLENDDQQGLAHFVEHMAFNGTKNFQKHELVNYLESIGMRFGPDLNAYTSFDETVYMLQVPTDSTHIVEKAFQILEDWAHNISFDDDEIDRERGVIVEEWRQGRGADMRMLDKQFPVLFHGSRYAERLPIGKKEIIEQFRHDTLRAFYKSWYRPDLMAVIAVGDFDKNQIESLIKQHFARIPSPKKPPKRIMYPLPDHDETLFAIATDPEATSNGVSIYYKHDAPPEGTVGDYRRQLVEYMYHGMFNQRLSELTKQSDPPFLYGYSTNTRMVLAKEMYVLGTGVKDNGIERGLDALMTEAARVRRFGFTLSEMNRQKQELLRFIEQAYSERDKTESGSFTNEYSRNFLADEPIPGIEVEYAIFNKYIPEITLEEVNRLATAWISDRNRVIMVNAPEKPGVKVPGEKEILTVIDTVSEKEIEPYVDTVSDRPLVETPPTPSPVVSERLIEKIGITEWTLANGVRVVLKPTDFKNDEIIFTSSSPGGYSLVPDRNFIAAKTASAIVNEGGAGPFNLIELDKKLSGKVVGVSPWISDLQEGITGNASPKDIETMFQLIYLYFTEPRKDSTAFLSYKSRMKGMIENRSARPETAFSDTVLVTMASYHPRMRPWTTALLDEMNLDASYDIYRDRFMDASDFTFYFVGNFDLSSIKPLVETYIGGLPSLKRKETWRDTGVMFPRGSIRKEVRAGIEQKSQVQLIFTGDFSWSYQNRYDMGSMTELLRIKLREVIREDMGGTYGVNVSQSLSHYPREQYQLTISFGCAPERVGELTAAVFTQIDSLKTSGTTDVYLEKVRESQKRQRETDLKDNSFWLNIMDFYYFNREDPLTVLQFDSMVENLSPDAVRKAANTYLDTNNLVQIILYPKDFKTR